MAFFQKDRSLLNDLFDAASFTILSWFKGISKMDSFIPGIVCTFHTFGHDLKWNPHIHMIVTEGAMDALHIGNLSIFFLLISFVKDL